MREEENMSTRIFYFTGSGNALAIARSIASGLGDTEIVPMAKHPSGYSGGNEERIGLVTPVYAWGPPRMVADFTRRLRPRAEQYVFAVATCGGTAGRTNIVLRKWLRANGSNLDAGFVVRGDVFASLPSMGEPLIMKLIRWLARNDMPRYAKDRIPEIAEAVAGKHPHTPETTNFAVDLVSSVVHGPILRSFKTSDKGFAAGDACTSCGTCTRVCPRENVVLVEGKPVWHHNCEACYACLHWCPEKAISFRGNPPTEPMHHPEVTLADMILREPNQ